MAWSVPMTFVSATALSAAQLNTYLRDNMNETAPGKATTPGYHFVSTGVNAIAERAWVGATVPTYETTTSTSYTDLATMGPQITCVTGSQVMWIITAQFANDTASSISMRASMAISGATTRAADDHKDLQADGLAAGNYIKQSSVFFEAVTPGTNTFTMKYRTNAGTAKFGERHLIVIAL